jgi:nitric oxide reductase subunit B
MQGTRKLWRSLAVVCLLSFAVLGWVGREIYLTAPPIPQQVVSDSGEVLFSRGQVQRGQQAWLSAGGQQLGTVWGHGSYVAPDWSADWLHREALALRQQRAEQRYGVPLEHLSTGQKGELDAALKAEMRRNRYDAATGTITVSIERAQAIHQVAAHYEGLFGDDGTLDRLREQYAMMPGSLKNSDDLHALPAFFFWSAWAAATDRPGETNLSYTSNWPHEPLVGNSPTAGNGIWSIASIILLIAGIAAMIWFHTARKDESDPTPPKADPLFSVKPTPSMCATTKYFFVVIGLILAQVAMGVNLRALRGGGPEFFWNSARADTSLHRKPDDPHAIRGPLDRDRMACNRPLYFSCIVRARAETAEARCRRTVLGIDLHRSGLDGIRVARHAAALGCGFQLLAR